MPVSTIPGVNSSYKTDKMIEDLMKVERIPLIKKENKVEEIQDNKKSWLNIRTTLSNLEESSKQLFGFENPFKEKIVKTEDENIITASATRDAEIQKFDIKVKQLASFDRLKSPSLSNDYKIKKGKYSFRVGNKEVSFYYKGGSIKEFSKLINKKGKDIVHSSVIRDSSKTQVLIIESKIPGKKNSLHFSNDARILALDMGMISDIPSGDGTDTLVNNKTILPNKNFKLKLPDLTEKKAILMLKYSFKSIDSENSTIITNQTENRPDGALIPISGSVTVEDVTVFQAPSKADIEKQNEITETKTDNEDLSSLGSGELIVFNRTTGIKPLENILPNEESTTLLFNTEDYLDLNSIEFTNIYQNKNFIIESVSISDSDAKDYSAINPLSLASNSKLEMDGLEIERETNNIDDLLYGVTLNLKGVSDENIEIAIESDIETIKNSVIEFVYNYNKAIETLLVLSTSNEGVIEELSYLSNDEKDELKEQLGTMKGNTTIMRIKNRLQILTTNAYKGNPDNEIVLLSNIGISTNATGSGDFNPSRLRGYLEMDDAKFENALLNNISDVKDFFGFDTNEDMVIDNGMGYAMSSNLRPYTGTGGLIYTKVSMYENQIDSIEKNIESLEKKLEQKEREYRIKFGKMEGMIEELNKSTKSLDGLNRNNNN